MARRLILVETAQLLPDWICRGKRIHDGPCLLLTPEIVLEPGERFRPGDKVLLNRPDGSPLVARIGGFTGIGGYGFGPPGVWINFESCLVIPDLQPGDVPAGTEVWSVDRPE
jgi:hypothetical protein